MVYLDKILHYHCPVTGMQNGDEALLSISLAGRGLLETMLIILEPHYIFRTYTFYHCRDTGMQNVDKSLPE